MKRLALLIILSLTTACSSDKSSAASDFDKNTSVDLDTSILFDSDQAISEDKGSLPDSDQYLPTLIPTYYVNFDQGSNLDDGKTKATAWKHSPGDENATDVPAAVTLQSGDIIVFKGGVRYRGSIVAKWSGKAGAPIIYDGNSQGSFGTGRAIIDGSEIIGEWQQCPSMPQCGNSPDWSSIWESTVPEDIDIFSLNMYAGDKMLWPAQSPNQPDPFFSDERDNYYAIHSDKITRTTLTDTERLNGKSITHFQGSYLKLWGNPNKIRTIPITSYDIAKSQLLFDDTGENSLYSDREVYYSLVNNFDYLDLPGEFVVSDLVIDKRRKIWLWPIEKGDPNKQEVTRSVRTKGIDLNDQDYVSVQGFRIQKYSGGQGAWGKGIAIYSTDGNHLLIKNNEMTMNRSLEHQAVVRIGEGSQIMVEDNNIFENPENRGAILSFKDSVFQNNVLRKNGYTAVDFYGCLRSKLLGNKVTEHTGNHANGLTLYLDNEDIMVAGNYVADGNNAMTLQDAKNITVAYNLFFAEGLVAVDWGAQVNHASDGLYYYNNLFMSTGDYSGGALSVGESSTNIVVKNNIMAGGPYGNEITRSHNIYTKLGWSQSDSYGWSLGVNEVVIEDLNQLFIDPAKGDYRLKAGSPAIDAGISVGINYDYLGNSVPKGKAEDIGPYEFVQ